MRAYLSWGILWKCSQLSKEMRCKLRYNKLVRCSKFSSLCGNLPGWTVRRLRFICLCDYLPCWFLCKFNNKNLCSKLPERILRRQSYKIMSDSMHLELIWLDINKALCCQLLLRSRLLWWYRLEDLRYSMQRQSILRPDFPSLCKLLSQNANSHLLWRPLQEMQHILPNLLLCRRHSLTLHYELSNRILWKLRK